MENYGKYGDLNWDVFEDLNTGITLDEYPRLGSLPEGVSIFFFLCRLYKLTPQT